MNQHFEFSLEQLGIIVVTIPAALIIMIGREWFLYNVIANAGIFSETHFVKNKKNPVLTFDIWSFFLITFWSFSWGGLIAREKKDTFISFIFAQLWYVILMIIAVIFLNTKNLSNVSYMYLLLSEIIHKSWILHLLNYIPLPPFDASYFYAQNPAWQKICFLSKILVTILIVLFPLHNDFITGDILFNWIGL